MGTPSHQIDVGQRHGNGDGERLFGVGQRPNDFEVGLEQRHAQLLLGAEVEAVLGRRQDGRRRRRRRRGVGPGAARRRCGVGRLCRPSGFPTRSTLLRHRCFIFFSLAL